MRLGDRRDLHAVLLGLIQIDLDVAPGIDYRRLPGGLATYKVARLR
jgi:hypothetical protein